MADNGRDCEYNNLYKSSRADFALGRYPHRTDKRLVRSQGYAKNRLSIRFTVRKAICRKKMAAGIKTLYLYRIAERQMCFVDKSTRKAYYNLLKIRQEENGELVTIPSPSSVIMTGKSDMFQDAMIFRQEKENTKNFIGFRGTTPSNLEISPMICYGKKNRWGLQAANLRTHDKDPQDGKHRLELRSVCAIFDPGAFSKVQPDSVSACCYESASALCCIPRICGFPDPIGCCAIYGHIFNTYHILHENNTKEEVAVDATCIQPQQMVDMRKLGLDNLKNLTVQIAQSAKDIADKINNTKENKAFGITFKETHNNYIILNNLFLFKMDNLTDKINNL